jgi:Ca2+/Na+ antiporter
MENFPIVHLVALVTGGIILLILKRKYQKMRNRELIIIFILYALLVALFTDQALNLAKKLISLLQI